MKAKHVILTAIGISLFLLTGCSSLSNHNGVAREIKKSKDIKPLKTAQDQGLYDRLDRVTRALEKLTTGQATVAKKKKPPASIFKAKAKPVHKQLSADEKSQITANTASIAQLRKAINELSLMELLNQKGKGYKALRYRFKRGSPVLSQTAKTDFLTLRTLEKEQKVKVDLVEGYSDDTGSTKKNQEIAEARARAAREFLVGHSSNPDVKTAAYAESYFHGLRSDNRCVVVYVKILVDNIDFDMRRL